MKRLLVCIIAIFFPTLVAAGDWGVEKRVDAMTDEVKKTARVENEFGHTFSIYRLTKDGPVWGNFSLSKEMFDQVDWEKPPIYRVDKNKPINLSDMKQLHKMGVGVSAYEWTPKWVNFLIWHGKQAEGIATELVQLMEGEKVVFRYFMFTGGYKDTSFSMKGAASAISEAIGINPEIDHAAQQGSEEFKKALIDETTLCRQNMSTFKSCFTTVNDCRKQAEQNIDKFKSCMQ